MVLQFLSCRLTRRVKIETRRLPTAKSFKKESGLGSFRLRNFTKLVLFGFEHSTVRFGG